MNCIQNKKQKIGILTYHRAENYGSALQAYALTHYLIQKGYDAEIIDYHSSAQDKMYSIFKPYRSGKDLIRNLQIACHFFSLKKKKDRFESFLSAYVKISKESFNEESDLSILNQRYDLFICGSDQIWNYQCCDFTKAYLLDFVQDKTKCISYAASLGIEQFDDAHKELYRDHLSEFYRISVREKIGAEYISALTGRTVATVPDPVMLLNAKDWNELICKPKIKRKYIFCYFIGDVVGMRDFAVKMKKKKNLPLVVVNINLRDEFYINKKKYSAGPTEFLSLLNNSEYICTNSFHAVVFSLLFHKNFWVFSSVDKLSSKSRIENITEYFDLQSRVINCEKALPDNIIEPIDYSDVDRKIDQLREVGVAFLNESLGKAIL